MSDATYIIGPDLKAEAAEILAESFYDYPVMRYVIEPGPQYGEQLLQFCRFAVESRFARGEVIVGVPGPSGLAGVATVSSAENGSPAEMDVLREGLWADLGPAAKERYDTFASACVPLPDGVKDLHLNMIGVRAGLQGGGYGRRLLDHVAQLSRESVYSSGVSLTTEKPKNVELYQHCGYELVGDRDVAGAFHTWTLFRPDTTLGP